jgi:hypothetical protein
MSSNISPRGYPLPHPENIAYQDATRIREAIGVIDHDITTLASVVDAGVSTLQGRTNAATETTAGIVRLATTVEAAAGTDLAAVPSVARSKAIAQAAASALVGAAPSTLDTLNELAAALGNDPNFATTMATAFGNRVRVDASQTFTSAQQQQARTNIGAAATAHSHAISDVTSLQGALDAKLPLAGGTLTGALYSAAINSSTAQNNDTASIRVQNSTGSGDNAVAALSFLCNSIYAVKLHLRADGYFGLGGWSAAAWRWYINCATGDMTAAGNVTAYSDPRLKDDVRRIEGALGILDRLDGVRFTWNDRSSLIGRPGQRDIGVLADQIEAVLPELVSLSVEDPDTGERYKTVAYDKLVPVLIEAMKELSARVTELEIRQ